MKEFRHQKADERGLKRASREDETTGSVAREFQASDRGGWLLKATNNLQECFRLLVPTLLKSQSHPGQKRVAALTTVLLAAEPAPSARRLRRPLPPPPAAAGRVDDQLHDGGQERRAGGGQQGGVAAVAAVALARDFSVEATEGAETQKKPSS